MRKNSKKQEQIPIETNEFDSLKLFNKQMDQKDNAKDNSAINLSTTAFINSLSDLSQDELLQVAKIVNKRRNFDDINTDIKSLDDLRFEYAKIRKVNNSIAVFVKIDKDINDMATLLSKEMGLNKSKMTSMAYILLYSFFKKHKEDEEYKEYLRMKKENEK